MGNYFVSELVGEGFNASSKARNDVERIFIESGLVALNRDAIYSASKKNVRYYFSTLMQSLKLAAAVRRITNSNIFWQYPIKKGAVLNKSVIKAARKNKLVLLVHDLDYLRSSKVLDEGNMVLRSAAVIISHNKSMTKYLVDEGISRDIIIELDVFDYLINSLNTMDRSKDDGIAFAGNLSKSAFLSEYEASTLPLLNLYGIGYEPRETVDNVVYHGSCTPEELVPLIKGGFGLVWDGTSISSCSGSMGQYLKYNNPHKMSLYLVSGMPIITWKQAAIADFVLDNGIGIVVDSLSEANGVISSLSAEDYAQMRENVFKVAKRLMSGQTLKDIISQIL